MIIYAHRGASGDHPENTLRSFRAAVEAGAKAIELDVFLAKDDQFIVAHDFILEDNGGRNIDLRTLTASDISSRRWNTKFEGECVPLLKQVLEALPVDIIINVEFKLGRLDSVKKTVRLIHQFLSASKNPARFIISSFNPWAIAYLHKTSTLRKAYLFDESPEGRMLSGLALFFKVQADAIHLSEHHPHLYKWQQRYPVSLYTVNNETDARRYSEEGISGIFSDFPGMLIRELGSPL